MKERFITVGEDLPRFGVVAVLCVGCLLLVFVVVESRRHRVSSLGVFAAFLGALTGLLLVALRPAWITAQLSTVPPRVVVLADQSERGRLADPPGTRGDHLAQALEKLQSRLGAGQMEVVGFGTDVGNGPTPQAFALERSGASPRTLAEALEGVEARLVERPRLIVIMTDGRWGWPEMELRLAHRMQARQTTQTRLALVEFARTTPNDASIRRLLSASTAVAHQSFALRVVVGCHRQQHCDRVPVVVREYRKGSPPALLARAEAIFAGREEVELELVVTLERAGMRLVEIGVEHQNWDQIPENDRRIVPFSVVRERLRLLHVAGQPTYDVRALRDWIKSDPSVDLVGFFILRGQKDVLEVKDERELGLIPFPVSELFTEHLASFDAVVLQDLDAEEAGLVPYLENLSRYVESGGGLMVLGGARAFLAGSYQNSPLERVLPMALMQRERPYDAVDFVPRLTDAGRSAALLRPFLEVTRGTWPAFAGANSFGPARPDAVVLLEHPARTALPFRSTHPPGPMPILAISEVRDGRVVALGLDSSFRLAFGEFAERTNRRAYGALYDALIGWVMREPRFEALRLELIEPCRAGKAARLRGVAEGQSGQDIALSIHELETITAPSRDLVGVIDADSSAEFTIEGLRPSGYSAIARLGRGPSTRFDFACQEGGEALFDPRPDPDRLRRFADLKHAQLLSYDELDRLKLPEPDRVIISRSVRPVLPTPILAVFTACALSIYWMLRRRAGLN